MAWFKPFGPASSCADEMKLATLINGRFLWKVDVKQVTCYMVCDQYHLKPQRKSFPWCLYVGCGLYCSAGSRAKGVNTEPGFVRAWERWGLSKSTRELCGCTYTQKRCLCHDATLLLLSSCYDRLHGIKISIPSVSPLRPPRGTVAADGHRTILVSWVDKVMWTERGIQRQLLHKF